MIAEDLRERVRLHCLTMLGVPVGSPPSPEERAAWRSVAPTLARLIRHRPVQVMVVADRIAETLKDESAPLPFLATMLPIDAVCEAGSLIRESLPSLARLGALIIEDHRKYSPMAASLLHAAGVGWKPSTGSAPRLSHAYLEGVDWPGITLPSSELIRTEMTGARLWKATLDNARLDSARLSRSRLSGASLRGISAIGADLSYADLSVVQADGAVFRRAKLMGARLGSASLRNAEFQGANLAGARFAKADLTDASFEDATIDDADFSGANLESAMLGGLTLTKADFADASFAAALLSRCNLEGMELPGANFPGARLVEALLTGSIMPGANFRNACLRGAGLAEIPLGRRLPRRRRPQGGELPHGLLEERPGQQHDRLRRQPYGLLHRRLRRARLQGPRGDPQGRPPRGRPPRGEYPRGRLLSGRPPWRHHRPHSGPTTSAAAGQSCTTALDRFSEQKWRVGLALPFPTSILK